MYPKNGNVLIFNFPGIFNIFTGSLQVSQDWNGGRSIRENPDRFLYGFQCLHVGSVLSASDVGGI